MANIIRANMFVKQISRKYQDFTTTADSNGFVENVHF